MGDGTGDGSEPSPTSATERYLSVFTLTVEVVHDEHPEYFGGLLVADIHEAMRLRGCDDATVTGWSWRDPTVPAEDGDDG